jgi:hypothetical protein
MKTQKYAVNQYLIESEFSRYLPCSHSTTIPQCRRMSVEADACQPYQTCGWQLPEVHRPPRKPFSGPTGVSSWPTAGRRERFQFLTFTPTWRYRLVVRSGRGRASANAEIETKEI